jgi:hypothetical protein
MSGWKAEAWSRSGARIVVHVHRESDGVKVEGEWAAQNGDVLHDEQGAAWRLFGVKTLEPQKGGGLYSWCQAHALDAASAATNTESAVQDPAQLDLEDLIEDAVAEAAPEAAPEIEPPAKARRKKVEATGDDADQ